MLRRPPQRQTFSPASRSSTSRSTVSTAILIRRAPSLSAGSTTWPASIQAVGLLQPIVVRPVAGGRYQVMAGERRWEAVRTLRHQTIAAVVRPVSNQQALEMTIVENLQRLEVTCMEQARGYERLAREFALTQEQMAERTGKPRSSVANFLRLLTLPPSVQAMLDQGQLSFGHAKALMALSSPEDIENLARRIATGWLTVRQIEKAVARLAHARTRAEKIHLLYPNLRQGEHQLQRRLGVPVTVTYRNRKGNILVEYSSPQELARILLLVAGRVLEVRCIFWDLYQGTASAVPKCWSRKHGL